MPRTEVEVKKKLKSVYLDEVTIAKITKIANKEKRSFSAQAAIILEEWAGTRMGVRATN